MVATEASRGIQLPHRRRRSSSKSANQYTRSILHDEVYTKERSDGSWLNNSYSSTSSNESLDSDYQLEQPENILDQETEDNSWTEESDEDDEIVAEQQSDTDETDSNNSSISNSPVTQRFQRNPSLSRQSGRQSVVSVNRIRRSSRQYTRHGLSRRDSNLWQRQAVDQLVKQAETYDFNTNCLYSYANTLLHQHLQNIDNEELVLDFSSPANDEEFEERVAQTSDESSVVEFNNEISSSQENTLVCIDNKYNSYSGGIPASAFQPSLIKWPGKNNNRKRRLSEIKKQVKLLSSIIKMTIEGTQDQLSNNEAGGVRGFANPAPFSKFVDMSVFPAAALASASAEDTFLPSIDEITEHLRNNKLKEAKAVLRGAGGAVTCPTRPSLWQDMCKKQTTEQFSDSFYYNTLQQIYGTSELNDCHVVLPPFVDHRHLGRGLTPDGLAACGRIISVLAYYYPPITYAPSLHPLAAALLLYMNESDVYNSLSALICSSKVTFATQTKISHEVAWRTTLVLARRHIGGAFSTLEKYSIDSKQVENAFQNWLWWILEGIPVPHMIRVIDCFLMEGWKVFVRVALAICQLYIRQVARDTSAAAHLSTKGLAESIKIFCQTMTITPSKLLKTAFGIRALSKSEIHKAMNRIELNLKRGGGIEDDAGTFHDEMSSHRTLDGLPTATSQSDVLMLSRTLNIKEGASALPKTRALGDYPIRHLVSKIANLDELLTIWNWIPVRMTMYHPSLLYTTEEHGSSLTTFYQRCEHHEPTILLVRTTCDHVFGAYLSASWDNRHKKDEYGNKQTYYGTGETFLFTLRPVPAKYQWVGITQQKANATLSHVKHSAELFMHGDDELITVGGGEGQGIMLDHELQYGKTETCQTFDNPPLCKSKDFEIKVVEVYGINVTNS